MGGGGASGSSGVPSNTSGQAVAYQPTAQPGADLSFQNLLSGFFGGLGPQFSSVASSAFPGTTVSGANAFSGTPGGVSYGYAQPFVGGAGTGTITDPNNPNYLSALQGSQGVASSFAPIAASLGQDYGFLTNPFNASAEQASNAAYQTGGALQALGQQGLNVGNYTTGLGNTLAGLTGYLAPGEIQNAASASNLSPSIAGAAPGLLNAGNTLQNYGNSVLNTAFDPQGALYNQLQNQVSQQSEAAAAAAGLGGSAYGASTVGNNLGNFNINWQNQQLQRQLSGLSGAGSADATAAGLDTSAGNLGLLAGQLTQLPFNTASSIGQLDQGIANLYNVGQSLGAQGISQMQQGASLPYQTQLGQANNSTALASALASGDTAALGLLQAPYNLQSTGTSNALQALGSLTNIGNQQYTIPQQVANDLQSYLQLGQAASSLSGQLGALGLNENQQGLAGIGSALGTGSNLLFGNSLGGSGGLLGAAGLNPFSSAAGAGSIGGSVLGGGGVGSLGAATDFAGGGDVAAGFAPIAADTGASSGGLGLTSLLPFGAS